MKQYLANHTLILILYVEVSWHWFMSIITSVCLCVTHSVSREPRVWLWDRYVDVLSLRDIVFWWIKNKIKIKYPISIGSAENEEYRENLHVSGCFHRTTQFFDGILSYRISNSPQMGSISQLHFSSNLCRYRSYRYIYTLVQVILIPDRNNKFRKCSDLLFKFVLTTYTILGLLG